jgi:hypothetical protein
MLSKSQCENILPTSRRRYRGVDGDKSRTYTEHGHKLRILKIRDNIVKIEKLVKRLRND